MNKTDQDESEVEQPAHLKVEGGADRDVYCNGERLDKSDAGHDHVELQRELDNGYTAEFTVGYDGTIGVGVRLYKFPVPDPVAETELECTDGEPRPTFEGELRGEEFLVEIVKRDERELATDGGVDQSEAAVEQYDPEQYPTRHAFRLVNDAHTKMCIVGNEIDDDELQELENEAREALMDLFNAMSDKRGFNESEFEDVYLNHGQEVWG